MEKFTTALPLNSSSLKNITFIIKNLQSSRPGFMETARQLPSSLSLPGISTEYEMPSINPPSATTSKVLLYS